MASWTRPRARDWPQGGVAVGRPESGIRSFMRLLVTSLLVVDQTSDSESAAGLTAGRGASLEGYGASWLSVSRMYTCESEGANLKLDLTEDSEPPAGPAHAQSESRPGANKLERGIRIASGVHVPRPLTVTRTPHARPFGRAARITLIDLSDPAGHLWMSLVMHSYELARSLNLLSRSNRRFAATSLSSFGTYEHC